MIATYYFLKIKIGANNKAAQVNLIKKKSLLSISKDHPSYFGAAECHPPGGQMYSFY